MNMAVKKAITIAESESKAYKEVKNELNELKSRKESTLPESDDAYLKTEI
jgi:hypothetical protein